MSEHQEHPSYGQISISRVTSSHGWPMYGSKLKHRAYVMLKISTSVAKRDLSQHWHYPIKELIRLRMSENQFAELIASLNHWSGTCCTFEYLNGERQPEPPFDNEREVVDGEFRDNVATVGQRLDALIKKLEAIAAPGSPAKKADITAALHEAQMARQEIVSNLPFVQKQFGEALDKMVTSAKQEVEAFVVNRLIEAGMKSLSGDSPVALIGESEACGVGKQEATDEARNEGAKA